MCGATDDKLFHIELVEFRLTEGRLELLIIGVFLIFSGCCTMSNTSPSITAGRMELQWTTPKLSLCWYRNKRKSFLIFLHVICLIFLDQKSFHQLFLYFENFCVFPDPSFLFFISKLIWLVLSSIESASLLRGKTDMWAWQRQGAVTATAASP